MTAFTILFTLSAVTQSAATDSLRLLALTLPDSALVEEVRKRSGEARDAVAAALAKSVGTPAAVRDTEVSVARRLGNAYALARRDSFLLQQVERFVAMSPAHRAAKVAADSVRRVGVRMYEQRGPRAAIAAWRRALARASAIDDSTGSAATLGNMGAAYARLDRLDSAATYLGRAITLAAVVGDRRVEANALAERAGVRESRDDLTGARDDYSQALALHERIGDTRGLAADYNNLGLLAVRIGDLEGAREQFEAALALNTREGRDVIAATNLVNLAGLDSRTGNFARAEASYRHALTTWRTNERWPDAADALRGLGQLDVRRGDYRQARDELREAAEIYIRVGLVDDAIASHRDLAGALAATGALQSALDELRRVQRVADSVAAPPGVRGHVALARADLAGQLNMAVEAERLYAIASSLYRKAGDREGEAEAQHGRALLFLDQDDLARARELLTASLATQRSSGNERGAALTRVALGELSIRRGDMTTARRELMRAAADLERVGDPIATAAALGARAALEAAARHPAAADSLYSAALARVGERPAPEVTWQLHAGLGALRERAGALDDAARELRASIADIERTSESLAAPERRSAFLVDKVGVYVRLALLEHSRGRLAEAFELSERTRAREMLELLNRGRVAMPRPATGLVAREQDLRRQIGELMRALERSDRPNQSLRGPDALLESAVVREALTQAQREYSDLLLEMRDDEPRHAALVSRAGASLRDVARKLSSDDVFVEYLVSDSASLAFVVTRDTATIVSLAVGRHALSQTIDFVRGTLRPRGNPRLDSLWRAPLRRLHDELISPLEQTGLLAGKTRLTLVPHAELHYLPFVALIDRLTGTYLVERFELVVTPSASVWLTLSARPAGRAAGGVLALAPKVDALPATRDEVGAIARLVGADARVLLGSLASEEAFRRDAPSYRVLHLATYGVLNRQNPLFSFVDLARGGSHDGRLEVNEVFGLMLAADLVVLSACQTAVGSGAVMDVPSGDDWVGLARAFLHAGAARVVASLWVVEDRATATLMERFYREYVRGVSAATALTGAQRALIAERATVHPFYWAGFQLVGDR
jgi:CHAT domain-containing protein